MGKDKTVILVSHRESTMAVAEKYIRWKTEGFHKNPENSFFFVMVGYNRNSESKMTVTKGETYESV